MFCVNCGKVMKENFKFCAYCGAKAEFVDEEKYSKGSQHVEENKDVSQNFNEVQTGWPVAIFKGDDFGEIKYFAYDIATESETEYCLSINDAVKAIVKDVENWKHSVEELPTEEKVKSDKYVKELINDEFELVKIEYLDIQLED